MGRRGAHIADSAEKTSDPCGASLGRVWVCVLGGKIGRQGRIFVMRVRLLGEHMPSLWLKLGLIPKSDMGWLEWGNGSTWLGCNPGVGGLRHDCIRC